MSPVTPEQRTQILSFLDKDPNVSSKEIAEKIGVTPGSVAAIKAHVTMGTYIAEGDESNEALDAIDAAFGLERDLQKALRDNDNIKQLDPGLTITDGGKEQSVSSGKIDTTARDAAGMTVVIELEVGPADRDAIGQILSYMGDLMGSTESVRGILIARKFSERAKAAARAATNIRLIRYGFQFSFEAVSAASTT